MEHSKCRALLSVPSAFPHSPCTRELTHHRKGRCIGWESTSLRPSLRPSLPGVVTAAREQRTNLRWRTTRVRFGFMRALVVLLLAALPAWGLLTPPASLPAWSGQTESCCSTSSWGSRFLGR